MILKFLMKMIAGKQYYGDNAAELEETRKFKEIEKRNQFMQDLIEEHRRMRSNSSSEKETKTMIDVLLSFQESEPEYCKDEIIKGMML
ncbi:unnamed protein product, partial [Ilex paraguariensis]